MNSFEIYGGNALNGEVEPQGAKNEALQVIACTLISSEKITIKNIPDILDVRMLIALLEDLGVEVEKLNAHTYTFHAREANLDFLISPEFKKKSGKLRGAVMLAGPLLARFRKA
ncbi:MAG TPA: UDP-N-acetylglucosamine 1-carboxyvinyltransferase, partial [Chitinophagaceae bacterium]|nr:UDP-N-acetylglucosamine 1-carboxyvinyltransferase [Chitinophagaceae bacterium]